jgi:hypothetical protein
LFGSIFIKKITKPKYFKKNQNQFKPTGFGLVWFGLVFRTKIGSNRFGSVFQFGSVFSVRFDSVQFFRFQAYKTEPVGFLKILISLIGFFHCSVFPVIFF